MEIILRENITSLGNVGDVVKVKDGYALNFLLPKRLAYVASEANKKRFEAERKILEAKQAEQREAAQKLSDRITQLTIKIAKQADEGDKLYGSVNAHDVADVLEKEGLHVDRKMISFTDPIKALGDYTVEIHLYADVVATLKVQVVKE